MYVRSRWIPRAAMYVGKHVCKKPMKETKISNRRFFHFFLLLLLLHGTSYITNRRMKYPVSRRKRRNQAIIFTLTRLVWRYIAGGG